MEYLSIARGLVMHRSTGMNRSTGINRSGGFNRSATLAGGGFPSRSPILRSLVDPRRRSLPRGTMLVLGSLAAALRLSHFPHLQANLWLLLPLAAIVAGTADTARCMRKRWDFYHGGVILSVYMDLLVFILVLFLLLYPVLA